MTQPEKPNPAEQAKLDAQKRPKGWAARYPKPEQSDIEELYTRLKPAFDQYFTLVQENRNVRYLQDETPQKWRRRLQNARRFRSRLSHNEILRIAAMMTRNSPKVKVPQSGSKVGDEKRGTKQSRWSNNLFQAFERRSHNPLLRPFCDNVAGDGMGVFEFYLTEESVYDSLETDPKEILPDDGSPRRMETADETMARLDAELEGAPLPFGLRRVDPLSVFFEEDEDGICAALIVELKPYRQVHNKLLSKSNEEVEKLRLPRPGTFGWPVAGQMSGTREDGSSDWFSDLLGGGEQTNAQSTVLTMRYYDRRWYTYIVGGVCVDGPSEHRLPGVPVFPCLGMVTGSPNMAERQQGITWGMTDMELFVNDLMTLELDTAYTYSRPKPVVETDKDSRAQTSDPKTKKPLTIDLSGDGTPYLEPGQRIVDAFSSFHPNPHADVVAAILQMWQRSGLNPIAQGESPGADAAGYTVNTLSQAAQSQYEILLDNYARCLGNVVDFARLTIRDTIKEKVYLSVPMQDAKKGGTEWLALGPEDVDETPSIVTIDPLSDANRMALRQSLEEGNKQGFVPREVVQRDGFGADDPEAWDDDLIVDAAEQDLAAMAREEAKAIIYGRRAAVGLPGDPNQQPPEAGAAGAPVGAGPMPPAPGQPAAMQAPAVGAANQAASTAFATAPGPAAMPASTAMAGQARGGGNGRAA